MAVWNKNTSYTPLPVDSIHLTRYRFKVMSERLARKVIDSIQVCNDRFFAIEVNSDVKHFTHNVIIHNACLAKKYPVQIRGILLNYVK